VLQRAAHVSPVVTGGQATIGLRVPAHPVAQALLREFAGGVAAPSANRFGAVSPTRAEHVRADLGAQTPLLLDGGPCAVGLESTILDVSGKSAVLLRPGGLSIEQICERADVVVELPKDESVRVPGRLPSHYATRATLMVVTPDELEERVTALVGRGARVGVLGPRPTSESADVVWRTSPVDAAGFARALYAELREIDQQRVDVILVVPPPAHGLGVAIADRLARAAAPR
jgi:L-threonylcarbamoyladenylate synthase